MEIKTFQISGAGNTFSLFWDNDRVIADDKKLMIAKDICEQTKTDGFIFLRWQVQKTSQELKNLEWDFYNNDGSVAEMCGECIPLCCFLFKKYSEIYNDSFYFKYSGWENLFKNN